MVERQEKYIFAETPRLQYPNFILVRMDLELMNLQGVSNWWEHERVLNDADKRTGMVEVVKEERAKRSIELWLQKFYEVEGYKVSVSEENKKRIIKVELNGEQFNVDVGETERKFQVHISKIISAEADFGKH